MSRSDSPRAVHWATSLVAATFTLGIFAATYMGAHMRMSGDDYCFGSVVAEHGFLAAQLHSYTDQPPYHGDRYSATFVAGLLSLAGPAAWASWTGLTLFGWVAAATWSGWRIARWAKYDQPVLAGGLVAVALVFLTVYQAPNRVQSVYWWSANVLYLMPLVAAWLLLGLVLWQARAPRPAPLAHVAILILAFLAGGFSEAAAAFQATWLLLALATTISLRRRLGRAARPAALALVVAALGSGLSLVGLALSPFSRRTLESLGSHPGPLLLLPTALRAGVSFLRETIQGLPTPTAVTLALGGVLGMLHSLRSQGKGSGRWTESVVAAFSFLAAAVVLAAAVQAPSLYAYNALPDSRALLPARHAMVMAFLAIGLTLGHLVVGMVPSDLKRSQFRAAVLTIALTAIAAYPLRGATQMTVDLPFYRRWAASWDTRHASILLARDSGQTDVQVVQIDHIIPSVSELTADPAFWYNQCAAGYYGVRSITADLAGWDE